MVRRVQVAAAAAALSLLSACGGGGGGALTGARSPGSGATPVSQGPEVIVKGRTPVQLYSDLARQIHACWLNPRDPVLKNYVFRAMARPGGQRLSGPAEIEIHEKTRDQKRGLKAFSINFTPIRNGTRIVSQNHRLDYALGQKLVSEVGYWAQGGANCEGPVSPAQSHPQIAGPRVTR